MRSVINGAIFNRFASNLDCTHDFKVSPAGEQERQIWGQFVPLLGFLTLFGTQKLGGLISMEPAPQWTWNMTGFCCIMMSKMWQYANFKFLSEKRPVGMGQFWVPEDAVVLNRAIFNCFASNFDCAIYFFYAIFFFYPNFFLPNFFFFLIFFCDIFFFFCWKIFFSIFFCC